MNVHRSRFGFVSAGIDAQTFAVIGVDGDETLSQPFRFVLDLVTAEAAVDFDRMLTAPATVSIHPADDGPAAAYHGVVERFEQLHAAGGYVFYRAELRPRLFLLEQSYRSAVYTHEQTIPELLATLLGQQLGANDFEFRLRQSYRPRTLVCQYQESLLNFIARWLEKEGIYYYFDHQSGCDRLLLIDDRSLQPQPPLRLYYRPADTLETGTATDALQQFVGRQRRLPRRVVLRDHNHRKAAVPLEAEAIVDAQGVGEWLRDDENFRDEREGRRYAQLRAEEIACRGREFAGVATAVGIRSGGLIRIAGHYRDDFNGDYLVTSVRHLGSQRGALLASSEETAYRCEFTALPASVQYRPPRLARKPSVTGLLKGVVGGGWPRLDDHGQYPLRMVFAGQHEGPPPRVRMATPYAGSDHGMHWPLYDGAEVLVACVNGDPDQPVITAAVPNSENPSVINGEEPATNRIATRGGNRLELVDEPGHESIQLHSPGGGALIGLGRLPVAQKRDHGQGGEGGEGSDDEASADDTADTYLRFSRMGAAEIALGCSQELTFGTAFSGHAGANSELSLGAANEIFVGPKASFEMAGGTSWSLNLQPPGMPELKSLNIDDTEQIDANFGPESHLYGDSYQVRVLDIDSQDPRMVEFEARMQQVRRFIRVFAAGMAAENLGVGVDINRRLNTPPDDQLHADRHLLASVLQAAGGCSLGVDGVAYIQMAAQAARKILEHADFPVKSKMIFDQQGVGISARHQDAHSLLQLANGTTGFLLCNHREADIAAAPVRDGHHRIAEVDDYRTQQRNHVGPGEHACELQGDEGILSLYARHAVYLGGKKIDQIASQQLQLRCGDAELGLADDRIAMRSGLNSEIAAEPASTKIACGNQVIVMDQTSITVCGELIRLA